MNLEFFNVQHVSFDLWLTLIKSNPVFKQKRDELLKDFFNIPHSIEAISAKIRMWDLRFTAINESSGRNIEAEEMVLIILADLECDIKNINSDHLTEYYRVMEDLFFNYRPHLIEENLPQFLKNLSDNEITISILSNTGFIKGQTLRKLLNKLDIEPFLKFQVYSDEISFAKPSKEAYNHLLSNVSGIKNSCILHIGDNENADFNGAAKNGLQSALINSNNVSLLNLKIHTAKVIS
jgi:putative hydrolase of the HAD superfamily